MEQEHLDVLIVEDDKDDFFIARTLLSKAKSIQCEVEWARSYEEGLESILTNGYDICLVDYRLGAHDGLDLLHEASQQGSDIPIILLTGQGDLHVDLSAMQAGAADYLVKGQIDSQLLERSIRYALERKRAEERIREQAALLDKARDAISAYDLEGRVIYWNKSAERLSGWTAEEMLGHEVAGRLYEPGYERIKQAWEAVRELGEWVGELRQQTKDGKELIVENRWTLVRDNAGNPKSILAIGTDITERKQLETQFLRAQRMESIGTLVGGIAHDLGNLLVPVLLGVKVLQQRYADNEKTSRTLEMIRRSAQRGADMVKQVLAFARGVEGERVPLLPGEVIHEVEKITGETFPAKIEVTVDVRDGLPMVLGDATQLQQVLMNLCVNARDAMPDGGRLTIEAEEIHIEDRQIHLNLDAKAGDYVCIRVKDTGMGIPPEVLDKVFEPFFTTKPTGKGTGLGLSTVYSIIKGHEGFVNVDSEVGAGTMFEVFLPVTQAPAPDAEGERRSFEGGNGELILLVDDEDFVLEVTRDTLEEIGYRVLTACNGHQALDVYKAHREEVDAVVTDLMMPEMDGVATIQALREIAPSLRIIAASGTTGSLPKQAMEAGAQAFLSKPFTAEKLYAVLSEVLHANGDGQDAS